LFSAFEFKFIKKLGRLYGISVVVRYLRNPNPNLTIPLLRSFGARVGHKTTIKRSIIIDNSFEDVNSSGDFSHLAIDNNSYIGDYVYFDLANEISIGKNAVISGRVSFITHADCNRSQFLSYKFPRICDPVVINDNSWVGFNTTLLAGSKVGPDTVIAAHSLLNKHAESGFLYSGIPAKKIRDLKS
jgi:acetyltransferase-like isoleucine patch superfamily enzyme